ncbi:MAG: putative porin [Bacteroidota bacterium]
MINTLRYLISFVFISILLVDEVAAQLPSGTSRSGNFGNANDSAGKKTNTEEWENEDAHIYYTKVFSSVKLYTDTSIHSIHRRPFSQPWYRDLGNLGSPAMNLMFTPQNPVGLSLGYHSFDALRFTIDSLRYYNTTKPYSDFTYNLGSKLEQVAQIFHTQNIKPYWNMAVNYRKINSPGYYFIQRNNHDNFFLSSNYKSPSMHYELYGGITYNKQQHDENGGIVSDTFFNNDQYSDRKSIPVNFYSSGYGSNLRSPVTTLQRDFTMMLEHAYTWGKKDTTYSKDSTQYDIHLTPRFRISHKAEMGLHRYLFKDLRPDSLRYDAFFQRKFATADSVYMRQEWFYADNRFLINGLMGKSTNQIIFNAGVGNRVDQFVTHYILGKSEENVLSNYLVGSLSKEATKSGQWAFGANAQLFVTGVAAGNFLLDASVSKDLGERWGTVKIGAKQQLNNAPYNYTIYQNQYWLRSNSFDKESSTKLFATIYSGRYKLSAGVNNYLMSNYLYFDAAQKPAQAATAFSLSQIWLRKIFHLGRFTFDNELLYQQQTNAAPVNVPQIVGRHQFAVETAIFKKQLKIATGIEIRYHSAYFANGYAPLFNQFYVQNTNQVANAPDGSVFFNFNIKRFRSYIMVDQVQQFFNSNIEISKGYHAQNAMLRFGFSWAMVN